MPAGHYHYRHCLATRSCPLHVPCLLPTQHAYSIPLQALHDTAVGSAVSQERRTKSRRSHRGVCSQLQTRENLIIPAGWQWRLWRRSAPARGPGSSPRARPKEAAAPPQGWPSSRGARRGGGGAADVAGALVVAAGAVLGAGGAPFTCQNRQKLLKSTLAASNVKRLTSWTLQQRNRVGCEGGRWGLPGSRCRR